MRLLGPKLEKSRANRGELINVFVPKSLVGGGDRLILAHKPIAKISLISRIARNVLLTS